MNGYYSSNNSFGGKKGNNSNHNSNKKNDNNLSPFLQASTSGMTISETSVSSYVSLLHELKSTTDSPVSSSSFSFSNLSPKTTFPSPSLKHQSSFAKEFFQAGNDHPALSCLNLSRCSIATPEVNDDKDSDEDKNTRHLLHAANPGENSKQQPHLYQNEQQQHLQSPHDDRFPLDDTSRHYRRGGRRPRQHLHQKQHDNRSRDNPGEHQQAKFNGYCNNDPKPQGYCYDSFDRAEDVRIYKGLTVGTIASSISGPDIHYSLERPHPRGDHQSRSQDDKTLTSRDQTYGYNDGCSRPYSKYDQHQSLAARSNHRHDTNSYTTDTSRKNTTRTTTAKTSSKQQLPKQHHDDQQDPQHPHSNHHNTTMSGAGVAAAAAAPTEYPLLRALSSGGSTGSMETHLPRYLGFTTHDPSYPPTYQHAHPSFRNHRHRSDATFRSGSPHKQQSVRDGFDSGARSTVTNEPDTQLGTSGAATSSSTAIGSSGFPFSASTSQGKLHKLARCESWFQDALHQGMSEESLQAVFLTSTRSKIDSSSSVSSASSHSYGRPRKRDLLSDDENEDNDNVDYYVGHRGKGGQKGKEQFSNAPKTAAADADTGKIQEEASLHLLEQYRILALHEAQQQLRQKQQILNQLLEKEKTDVLQEQQQKQQPQQNVGRTSAEAYAVANNANQVPEEKRRTQPRLVPGRPQSPPTIIPRPEFISPVETTIASFSEGFPPVETCLQLILSQSPALSPDRSKQRFHDFRQQYYKDQEEELQRVMRVKNKQRNVCSSNSSASSTTNSCSSSSSSGKQLPHANCCVACQSHSVFVRKVQFPPHPSEPALSCSSPFQESRQDEKKRHQQYNSTEEESHYLVACPDCYTVSRI